MPSRIDIGRIGDDQVVALAAERLEQVAAVQRDAVFEPVIGDIARGDLERVLGDIDRIDRGIGKMPRGEDRKAAGAGAEIEHAFDRGGIVDQRAASSSSPPKCESSSSPMKERGTITRSST